MKQNMGTADSIIRIAVAAIILLLYFTKVISGTVAIIALALAAIFILTSLVRFCPLYLPFKINTKKDKK